MFNFFEPSAYLLSWSTMRGLAIDTFSLIKRSLIACFGGWRILLLPIVAWALQFEEGWSYKIFLFYQCNNEKPSLTLGIIGVLWIVAMGLISYTITKIYRCWIHKHGNKVLHGMSPVERFPFWFLLLLYCIKSLPTDGFLLFFGIARAVLQFSSLLILIGMLQWPIRIWVTFSILFYNSKPEEPNILIKSMVRALRLVGYTLPFILICSLANKLFMGVISRTYFACNLPSFADNLAIHFITPVTIWFFSVPLMCEIFSRLRTQFPELFPKKDLIKED